MINLTLVLGPPCSGKTTYIKENFPPEKIIYAGQLFSEYLRILDIDKSQYTSLFKKFESQNIEINIKNVSDFLKIEGLFNNSKSSSDNYYSFLIGYFGVFKKGLFPDNIAIHIFSSLNLESDKEYVIDSFPKTIKQFKWLRENFNIKKVLILSRDEKDIKKDSLKRLICQDCGLPLKNNKKICNCDGQIIKRKEDFIHKERILSYKKYTQPLVDYIISLNEVIEVQNVII